MESLKKGDKVEVQIEKLIYGGAGLARLNGQVLFVDFAAPGDRLEVLIIETKKNFARAKILNILEPSPYRKAAECAVFGRCGGCQWQHIDYNYQIVAKQNILKDVLSRFFPNEDIKVSDFKESNKAYNYRNRIQIRVEQGKVGFYGKGSHELVPIKECPIAEVKLNQEISHLINSNPKDGKYRIQIGINGTTTLTDLNENEEPLGFSQINTLQNINLQKEIQNCYSDYQGAPIIDLYGGYGNFALPLAKIFPQISIESIEWNRAATEEGIDLALQQGAKKLRFINSDVESFLQRVDLPLDSFIILDPPRAGCSATVIQELALKSPKILVYISCDPMTWGRDGQLFLKESQLNGQNYCIATIHGLDMFPQTDHIEIFSVFKRIN